MDALLIDFGSALLRWTHVITAIAWIGSSFYFMHLDAALKPARGIPAGKGGATWEVHGGGFYEVRKYLEVPAHLPEDLIWHKWQSYSTWITGFFLLCWVYYAQSQLYLIDPAVRALSPIEAAGIGLAALVIGWLCYDLLCRSPLANNEPVLAAVGFAFVVGLAFTLQQVFSGRGALVHIGAVMATMMSGNVFFVIIPGQKKIIAALSAGQPPDPALGKRAKIRSTHNNYLTLPVIFLMLSNHYPLFYSTPYAWVIVGLVLVAGALVRVFYNLRHAGKGDLWWTWIVAGLCLLAAFAIGAAGSPIGREALHLSGLPVPATAVALPKAPEPVTEIVISRCSMCHAREPVWPGIAFPPKGIVLDTPEAIARNKPSIRMQAVLSRAMPPNNLTELSSGERKVLASWTH
jgi:uncharacterized membrane protein